MMSKTARVTLSLPSDVCTDLDEVCGMLNLSRSAYVSALLATSLPTARAFAKTLSGDGGVVSGGRRYSESSVEGINDIIRRLGDAQADLFNTK